ncbi:sensor histidine kinase [Marinomonas ostreistagni]|uniref:sensor histidine kinase n=1 Tax=Marinomonas ostreistagni TaxID=359209 RepID=UPI001952032B|nr:HAMP domain-containing sensor histidine kinase [Marinomonas ostreistagni]MBM6551117.1 HAMP domain-containing histidine kinase [Marinomonas ostreistagni]
MPALFRNADSMTGRLALFFISVAITVGLFCLILISVVLAWSEDRVGERRIMIDKQQAIQYFLAYPNIKSVQLDPLTIAYNGLQHAPKQIRDYLAGQEEFIGEVGQGSDSRMLYMTTYTKRGETRQMALVSKIDAIEISLQEYMNVMAIIVTLVVLLIGCFTAILTRLSKSLIQPINYLCAQLSDHQGDTNRVFNVPQDAAQEFQTLTNTLNQYRSDMDALMKREQAFARYASHELRTPLTVMKGSCNLLAKTDNSPFAMRQVERMRHATEHMLTMVDALLGLVRYEKSHNNTPCRTLSFEEVRSLIDKHQAQAEAKQLQLTFVCQGTPRTHATPAVIDMALGNLLRNSIAASESGIIEVRLQEHCISVSDQGQGYDPNQESQGHGLGLLIVQDICQRYGWRYTLVNKAQGGCLATLDLRDEPLAPDVETAALPTIP